MHASILGDAELLQRPERLLSSLALGHISSYGVTAPMIVSVRLAQSKCVLCANTGRRRDRPADELVGHWVHSPFTSRPAE